MIFQMYSDMECPTCRKQHVLKTEQVEAMPKNLALENIVFRFQVSPVHLNENRSPQSLL